MYDVQLQKILGEMRMDLEKGVIPAIKKGQKCNGCSMKDLCMPSVKKVKSIVSEIQKICETEIESN